MDTATAALTSRERAVRARDWPSNLKGLDHPGLYAWIVDPAGAHELSDGFGVHLKPGLFYVGEAGVRTQAVLADRIDCHICRCMAARSTLRRTLACGLLKERGWTVVAPRKLAAGCESELTGWIRSHLRVSFHPFPNRQVLKRLEAGVQHELPPALNLSRSRRDDTPIQGRLRYLRRLYRLQ